MFDAGRAPVLEQLHEVVIPIVVISPSGDVELAKYASSGSIPPAQPASKAKAAPKSSSTVILTHGMPP